MRLYIQFSVPLLQTHPSIVWINNLGVRLDIIYMFSLNSVDGATTIDPPLSFLLCSLNDDVDKPNIGKKTNKLLIIHMRLIGK